MTPAENELLQSLGQSLTKSAALTSIYVFFYGALYCVLIQELYPTHIYEQECLSYSSERLS